ncbi:methylated-DNA--[protein]-cysteine S-methyltransferase [Candidatus Solirubrobacter pratensis]|uniref:methylated-DNA--[protein]-cysteine S-methyltransferase n=1 Tax=Candidatus Solirubrobacter pratensis TaxID=1298857 RepID=UPI000405571A|nr:methylated-DNA--[protein]-cysteine S-methyltransferase [Candidatus Solirubrobacter pratensis]
MTPLPESLLESVAAAAVREGLADAVFTRLKSPIGKLLVVNGPDGIVRVGFEEEAEDRALAEVAAALGPRIVASDRELASERDALSEYLEGGRTTLDDIAVDLRLMAAPFRHRVLEELHRSVHRGETVTYGELAARAGNPKASRAVGSACARNPVPIVVPCHRVLPGSGGIGNYGGGPARKRVLLELEGAIPRTLSP